MLSDLIKKYYETKDLLDSESIYRKKLVIIINFFGECEKQNHFPPSESFFNEFVPEIIKIFNNSNINFIDPHYLKSARIILDYSKKIFSEEIILNHIKTTIEFIDIQLLKLYFYLGELEEGISVLNRMIRESSVTRSEPEKEKQYSEKEILTDGNKDKPGKKKNALVRSETYKEHRAFEILKEIKFELDRLNSYSHSEINVILAEESGNQDKCEINFGVVQKLSCEFKDKKKISSSLSGDRQFQFSNIIAEDKSDAKTNSEILKYSLNSLLQSTNNIGYSDKYSAILSYDSPKNIYKGKSFLYPAAVVSLCNYLKFRNRRKRFSVNLSAGFTGEIDNKGNLITLHNEILNTKIYTAFFSWLNVIVLPDGNLYEAKEIISLLNKKYPKKKLEIIGVKNVSEMSILGNVIKQEIDSLNVHTRKFIKRHSLSAGLIASFIMLLIGFLLAYNYIPRDIKELPTPTRSISLIYAPDRDTSWIFNGYCDFYKDTLNFGETAIGDMWFYAIQFFNNSRKSEHFQYSIEGKDKSQFNIDWAIDQNQIEAPGILLPDIPLLFFVKFTPYGDTGTKKAELRVTCEETGKSKIIPLVAKSGYFNNGYSIKFNNFDDQLIIDTKQNVLRDEFAFDFWYKPNSAESGEDFLMFEDNPLSNNKLTLFYSVDRKLSLWLYSSKNNVIAKKNILEEDINFNEWNYIAVTYKNGELTFIINDKFKSFNTGEGSLKQIQDYIILG